MESKFMSIKEWAHEDRPREKLILKGVSALSDAELFAIILATGTKNESALDIAKRVLHSSNNNMDDLAKLSFADFQKIKGIGPAKAISLIAALEIGRRRNLAEAKQVQVISSSKDIYLLMHPKLGDLHHEEFHVLYLNRRNVIIGDKVISSGGVSGTVIDVKIIGKSALEFLASGIILTHNHPSGNLQPSSADIDITNKIKQAAQYFDCTVLDHVIVTQQGYFSFADEGIL